MELSVASVRHVNKLISDKVKSRWQSPFRVTDTTLYVIFKERKDNGDGTSVACNYGGHSN